MPGGAAEWEWANLGRSPALGWPEWDGSRGGRCLAPLTEAQYLAWRDDAVFAYAQDRRRRGGVAADEARGGARREGDSLVLEGASSPGRHLLSTRDADGGERVGMVRLAAGVGAARPQASIQDIRMWSVGRGRGCGRALLARGGFGARRLGLPRVGRPVLGQNACARRLHETVVHRGMNLLLAKGLG